MPEVAPPSTAQHIELIRAGFCCDRCGRYVGALAGGTYLPPIYPVATADTIDDEARSLVAFELHMLGLLRQNKFILRHPQREGACITARAWAAEDAEGEDQEDDDGVAAADLDR
jgi:hypothetical protein